MNKHSSNLTAWPAPTLVPSSMVACAPRRSIRLWPTTMSARSAPAQDATWLDRFHAGERDVMEGCYRDQFRVVENAVGHILRGADKETVIHEVFLQLMSRAALRRGFTGGGFSAWLATVARNQAIDFWRRYRNERSLDETSDQAALADPTQPIERFERGVDARLVIERFRRELLPPKWAALFEARFVGGLDQRSAASRLGISRTTLAYQEIQVRRLLRRFLLGRGKR
jgi:RNA polymerase sigma-70 factor (ECF subfamily)